MDQEGPESVGRVLFTDTPLATPAPLLVTVMVNPMVSSADTASLSITSLSLHDALPISMDAEALSDPSLVVVTLAVLSTGELAAVRAVVHTAVFKAHSAPEAMSPKEQNRTPAEMEQRA